MTDPERLVDRPPSDLAATLLRAGSDEAPPDRSLRRTLSAVGLGATALGASASASAAAVAGVAKVAGSITAVGLFKWAGMGVVGGVVVAAASHGFQRPVERAPGAAIVASANLPDMPEPAPEPPPRVSWPAPVAPEVSPEPAPAFPRKRAERDEQDTPLAREVSFVDHGRSAFQRGELAAALAALQGYEREFPGARLLPEVLYLRMQAEKQRGNGARALELARRIVQEFPRSPHAASARAIVEDAT